MTTDSNAAEVSREQALAGLRVLVQVCRADGIVSEEEREALEPSMDALGLDDAEREAILAEEVDLDAALANVTDEAVRREVLLAAEAVARADGIVDSEQVVIARARAAWGLEPERMSMLDDLRAQLKDDLAGEDAEAIEDPVAREEAVARLIKSRAIGLGALGLVPTNLVTEAAGAYLQIQMVRTIGRYHGHAGDSTITSALVASLVGVVTLHAGLGALVRLVPVWGNAIGAAAGFGTTWALGWTANDWFESGGELDKKALREAFRSYRERGEAAYEEEAPAEEERWRGRSTDISELTRRFVHGEASAHELARKFKDDLEE
ncbi:MAG: TerB family tellurite resistance protein [Myxococcales bacterium]|nr:TerB family tellurite resistance protein [Myxococcales bacterium]